MRVAVYIRVSTEEQKSDLQKDACENYCKMKGWSNPSLFIDHGESGAKVSRPAFDSLMGHVRSKQFDAVLTWKFDRIGRSTAHLISFVEELKRLNVEFISITEAVDTTTATGKMIFTILAGIAEFERETLIMRTNAGIKAAKERGKHCGRPVTKAEAISAAVDDILDRNASIKDAAIRHGVSRASIYRELIKRRLPA